MRQYDEHCGDELLCSHLKTRRVKQRCAKGKMKESDALFGSTCQSQGEGENEEGSLALLLGGGM